MLQWLSLQWLIWQCCQGDHVPVPLVDHLKHIGQARVEKRGTEFMCPYQNERRPHHMCARTQNPRHVSPIPVRRGFTRSCCYSWDTRLPPCRSLLTVPSSNIPPPTPCRSLPIKPIFVTIKMLVQQSLPCRPPATSPLAGHCLWSLRSPATPVLNEKESKILR